MHTTIPAVTMTPILPSAPPVVRQLAMAVGLAVLCAVPASAQTSNIPIANPSFELPDASGSPTGVSTVIDSWQKTPQPGYFDPNVFFLTWDSVAGIFPNAPVGDPRHLLNADGNQVAYIFAFPQAGITQDLSASFTPGVSYSLNFGLRGGGSLTAGTQFLAGLQYFDGTGWFFAGSQIVYATSDYNTTQLLQTINVSVPTVQSSDVWAGKPIRVELEGISFNGASGLAYWEADNVSLTASAVPEPQNYALVAAVGLLGGALWRRSRQTR
jgi:hypothetical protein